MSCCCSEVFVKIFAEKSQNTDEQKTELSGAFSTQSIHDQQSDHIGKQKIKWWRSEQNLHLDD